MNDPGKLIAKLSFTGAGKEPAELPLSHGLNVIFGASNTGKSFAVKTIDFMLGGTRPLPDIEERNGYERVWMALKLPKSGDVTLMRALAGGALELHAGHVKDMKRMTKASAACLRSTIPQMLTTSRRDAANIEIEKIKKQQAELQATIQQLDVEGRDIERTLEALEDSFTSLESELAQLAPAADVAEKRLDEVLSIRDNIRRGLSLIEQKDALLIRREDLSASKPASKAERPQLGVSGTIMHDFAQKVGAVLTEWHFPGNRHVAFDDSTYDLRIDGKSRKDNGKGVRAVTHAAFKVALLVFCRERKLPHPGFLILDTPLLTYRDPLTSREGALSADEQALRNTNPPSA
jgi:hypothetical protein